MIPEVQNLFDDGGSQGPQEHFLTLAAAAGARVERIASHGQASPAEGWYDQERVEWVLLARGEAALEFAGGETLLLKAGDYLLLPARLKHRVSRASMDAVWLAVHLE